MISLGVESKSSAPVVALLLVIIGSRELLSCNVEIEKMKAFFRKWSNVNPAGMAVFDISRSVVARFLCEK